MSGYDSKTGIFSLHRSKAVSYLIRNKDLQIKDGEDWSSYCIKLFKNKGFTVIKETIYGIDIVADNAQIWEVLSGEPADWGHAIPSAQDVYKNPISLLHQIKSF